MNQNAPYALDIVTTPDLAFDLADALGMDGEMSALGVTIFDVPDGKMLIQGLYATFAEASAALGQLSLTGEAEVRIHQLPDTDWVSETQSGLPPVIAGRFFVHGAHDADVIPNNVVPIHVEAGLAFGSGHHGTTAGCLLILDKLLANPKRIGAVLDLGCGAGILAIAAAKSLPNATILATDIDEDAVMVTTENAAQNHVADRIATHAADGFESGALRGKTFDLIFANILAGPLMELADHIVDATAPNGRVILSGILDAKADEVIARFEAAGLQVTPQPSLDGWTSLLATKSQ